MLFYFKLFCGKRSKVNSTFRSAKLSTYVNELWRSLYIKFCPWQHVPHLLPVPWSPFHRNSSLLRWEEASMLCNPTLYPSWKKLGEKRHVTGWQIHTEYQTNRPGQSLQLLRRNIPAYQEKFTLRRVVDNTGLVPPFQRKNTAPSVTGSDSAVQLPLTHG